MRVIRTATPQDIAACQAIDRALGQDVATEAAFGRAIADGRVLAAAEHGAVAGYLWWSWLWDKWPFCTLVRVHPEYQRRGLGRALYEAVEQDLRALGHRFWLSSTEEDNAVSLAFHRALGFRAIGRVAELEQNSLEVFLRKDL